MKRKAVVGPMACVMGDMNVVRPLGLAGISCAVVAPPGNPTTYSRFVRAVLPWQSFSKNLDALADMLLRFGTAQQEPPVLFFEEDSHLLFMSRYRERLGQAFRFILPEVALVEDLVDKARFQFLAERLSLPVPASRRIRPCADSVPVSIDLRFPVVIKPLRRRSPWEFIASGGKAIEVATEEAFRELWPRLASNEMDLLVQEMIPGPESCIESYHVYVDHRGEIAGEFTGRKIRTYPPSCGHSTALETTDAADVASLGHALVEKLNLHGVAKFDFKRDPDGALHLLEVNPRFNLWHVLGARAGVNIPALVYADLTGQSRPPPAKARPGIRWCTLPSDWFAARAIGLPLRSWLPWVIRCEVTSHLSWDDPVLLQTAWHWGMSSVGERLSRLMQPAHRGEA
ncbi:putative ATP-grasp superfamily ATP-dependent carboligase [Mycoplana sp. BE70]|uniref:carboxylate--amine ligase n=1 Tax=Mycoplana sp. BE70 TaxID=2817775 RepID=UPI002864F3BD|nr:ATP-grasp domain-containing protein [Mycoplana sp. BE70]MDR6756391.1 putative ATP-grasp superfamily ATP-dependent carboligase [Mycoplana sp. BE70]